MHSIFSLVMLVEPSIPKTKGKLESALTGKKKYKSQEVTFADGPNTKAAPLLLQFLIYSSHTPNPSSHLNPSVS